METHYASDKDTGAVLTCCVGAGRAAQAGIRSEGRGETQRQISDDLYSGYFLESIFFERAFTTSVINLWKYELPFLI